VPPNEVKVGNVWHLLPRVFLFLFPARLGRKRRSVSNNFMTSLINAYLSLLGSVPVLGLILMAAVSVSVGDYAGHRDCHLQRNTFPPTDNRSDLRHYFRLGSDNLRALNLQGSCALSRAWPSADEQSRLHIQRCRQNRLDQSTSVRSAKFDQASYAYLQFNCTG
jgi:hypothetical protein